MAQIANRIKSLVRGLYEDKQAAKELEDSINKDSAELKSWMSSKKADKMEVDDITVTYKPQVRSTMDEQKTLEIIHRIASKAETEELQARILNCVETKEVINEQELEKLIYDGIIEKEELEPAMLSKTIFVLNLRKKAKKA